MSLTDLLKLTGTQLGISGVLFFALYVGWVPSPILAKLEAQENSSMELVEVVKRQCGILARMAKESDVQCYLPWRVRQRPANSIYGTEDGAIPAVRGGPRGDQSP